MEGKRMALLNAVNTATQAVVANGFIAYTAINVKQGCGIKFNDGSNTISLKGNGIYLVEVNADVVPTNAELISMQLLKNNVVVPAAKATVTGVASSTSSLSFSTLIKVPCSCNCVDNTANLQVQLTALANVTNASIVVVRIA